MIRLTAVFAACIAVLAGCMPAAPEEQAIVAVPALTSCPEPSAPFYDPFPEGITPTFSYHLRSDRVYVHSSGKDRRRVVIELLDTDAAGALAILKQSLSESGFRARTEKTTDGNRVSSPWSKSKVGTIVLTATSEIGPKPSNPRAHGVISVDYPLPASMRDSPSHSK